MLLNILKEMINVVNAAKGGASQEHFGLYHNKVRRFLKNGNPAVVYIPNSVRQVGRFPALWQGNSNS